MAKAIDEATDSPFTSNDLQKLLKEAHEPLSTDKSGWIFLNKTNSVELWKKSANGSSVNLIKGSLLFPGIPPDDVYRLIVDIDLRRKWEKQIIVLEVIEDKQSHRTIYWLLKTPFGTDNRDFVQHMVHGRDETGTIYILYKNAVHPSRPEKPGVVRAETLFSGTLIYPDESDPNSTRLVLVVQDDIKGHVPKAIVNHFYAKAPIEWHQNITSFYHEVYSKERTS